MNYIIIDVSYLIFYRYFALLQWWKMAKPEEPIDNPIENKEFVDKFRKTIQESVETIKKNLKLHTNRRQNPPVKVIMARDCPRKEIWRMKLYPEYKGTREKDDTFMGGPFFSMVYKEKLLYNTECKDILYEPHLEADDIIAITTNYLKNSPDTEKIYIIANDMDYLQLCSENCHVVNLKKQYLMENKKAYPQADKNLMVKIILGDKSDNIEPVFKRCSIKQAEMLYDNQELLQERLKQENAYEKIQLNSTLIDFNEIPIDYKARVFTKLETIFNTNKVNCNDGI